MALASMPDMRLSSGLIVTVITVSRKDKSNYLMPPLKNRTYVEGVRLLEQSVDCSYDHENTSTCHYGARCCRWSTDLTNGIVSCRLLRFVSVSLIGDGRV